MDLLDGLRLHANYNQWINLRLIEASEKLTEEERYQDQAAFFGSIAGTLNHVIVGDTIWLRRFMQAPIAANELHAEQALAWMAQPESLDQMLFTHWQDLRDMREKLDQLLLDWTGALNPQDTDHLLQYKNTKGRPYKRSLGLLLTHFFNHQTHHRGQTTTLLFQNGIDPGITDMLAVIPEVS